MEEETIYHLEFLTEEETYQDQLFFDLDFDPKFNPGFLVKNDSIDDILSDFCDQIEYFYDFYNF